MHIIDTSHMDPDRFAEQLAAATPPGEVLDARAFDKLPVNGLIERLIACEKNRRRNEAETACVLGALDRAQQGGIDGIEDEVNAALAWPPAVTQERLAEAGALTRRFPETVQLLARGTVSREQAYALVRATAVLDDDKARHVQDKVLARMPLVSLASTRRSLRYHVERADPEAAIKRHSLEKTRRCVEVRPEGDGMSTLALYATAETVNAIMTKLTRCAKKRAKHDKRTLDQRRADLLARMILQGAGVRSGTQDPATPARVNVVVGIETLLGLGQQPGELEGYGPICAEQARRIAHAKGSLWRFLLTASDGTLVDVSPDNYTARAATRRFVQLKYRTCTFPNCSMPAERCDLDHGLAFHKGGRTVVGNLGPICRKHHNLKSQGGWQLDRVEDIILWTSTLTGRTSATGPTRYLQAA